MCSNSGCSTASRTRGSIMYPHGTANGPYAWESDRPSQNQERHKAKENSNGIPRGGFSMRSRAARILFELVAVVALGFLLNSCGSQPYCPTCGTTVNGAYGVINIIPVPEHNPTGEPGGPFNSFDISWFDPTLQRVYTSDRIGLDVVVVDAKNNFAVNTIGGQNEVANAGNNNSVCIGPANPAPGFTAANTPTIPSIITSS